MTTHPHIATQRRHHRRHAPAPQPAPGGDPQQAPPADGGTPTTDGPQFAQPTPIPGEDKYKVTHPSDNDAYKILDGEERAGELQPTGFPAARGGTEPVLTLEQVLGPFAKRRLAQIAGAKQLVFHAVGDTGNVRSAAHQNDVAAKMEADFEGEDPGQVPSFFFHLGDVIYNFGEVAYYYDQFYDPYRNYPAPILGIAGNHDGIVSPLASYPTLEGFLRNFCAETFEVLPEAGGLDRTAQIQPGVYYTFEAPYLRVLALYTNTLEDPGVLSSQGGTFKDVPDLQLDYLRAALTRIKSEKYAGALIIAHHHPIYTYGGGHGDSMDVLADIDAICTEIGVWPHAVLTAHVHNYQRYTRHHAGREIPYIIAGNGGHGIQRLTSSTKTVIRTPSTVQTKPDLVELANYDDSDYGYLRILANDTQLRIEYHPASDGAASKTPDDSVTVDLASGTLAVWKAT
jgi:hypothetical protein